MSPEQMRSPRDVDARTDIWALGVILYQLLTGEPPFRAESVPELVTKVAQGAPRKPSSIVADLPRELDAVLLRCFERDLDRRYANVGELSSALLPFAPSEARASIERIARVLATASHGRGALPSAPRVILGHDGGSAPKLPGVDRDGALGVTAPVTGRDGGYPQTPGRSTAIARTPVAASPPSAPRETPPDGPSAAGAQTTPGPQNPGPPVPGTSGDAWVNTAFGSGTIAVHRWKLWAILAAAGALSLGGVVAFVASRLAMGAPLGAAPSSAPPVTMGAPLGEAPSSAPLSRWGLRSAQRRALPPNPRSSSKRAPRPNPPSWCSRR